MATGCIQSLAPTVVGVAGSPVARSGGPSADEAAPAAAPDAAPTAAASTARPALVTVANAGLMSHNLEIPVAGVSPDALEDSFDAPREGERVHHAIDIMAPRGTPVLAADDGRVLRVSSNNLGGLTVYTIDKSGQYVYYYAHLEGYARGLAAGNIVFKGDTLGFVGTTGDAPDNLPHLHFQILRMPPDGKYWNGDAIDPFPLLSQGGTRIVGNR
jgi:murein DD-endopeptidase MepM/ murein hydrolase activator NlpD